MIRPSFSATAGNFHSRIVRLIIVTDSGTERIVRLSAKSDDTAKDKTKAYKILSIDASELFDYVIKDEPFCICNEFGKIDFDKFTASIYTSLETK